MCVTVLQALVMAADVANDRIAAGMGGVSEFKSAHNTHVEAGLHHTRPHPHSTLPARGFNPPGRTVSVRGD